jgi:hypothetical protein
MTASLQQRLQIFSKTQVFLAALAFARAKSTAERRIENAGYRHRLLPAILQNGARLGQRGSFGSMTRREASQPQTKLSFDLTLASPDMSPKHYKAVIDLPGIDQVVALAPAEIDAIETREITPYLWVHPNEER